MIEPVEGKQNLVIKRDGRLEPYSYNKLYRVILWACNGSQVFTEQLIEAVSIKIHNKIRIEKLYDEVIDTASNMISGLYPQWEQIAKNLYLLKIHKEIGVKRTEYPDYSNVVKNNIDIGLYSKTLIEELEKYGIKLSDLGKEINSDYDKLFTFGGLNLFVQKYCNQHKKALYELPQHVYMKVAIQLMYKDGLQAIIDKYHQLAKHEVTEATPKMVNALRNSPAMFSCCLVRPTDSLEGINESINMLAKESKYSGGTAWDASLIRATGASVEGNNGSSSGTKPYIKALQETVTGYNQGNTRSAACLVTYDSFHYESPEMTQLKHESGKDEDRARKLQYSVKWRPRLSQAIRDNEDIYLIDPHKTQDLFEAYGQEWDELYEKYIRNTHVHKRKFNARDLAFEITRSSGETGNLYYYFPDNANLQNIGAGYIPASNLCQEMMMSYDPIQSTSAKLINDKAQFEFEGDIALCNLASINLIKWAAKSPKEKEESMYLLVKSADNAIDNSFYINPLGEKHSKQHRNLGIGTSNYANLLASKRYLWDSEEARKLTHELYEELSYYAIKASIQLAKERSRCDVFNETRWAKGLFPHEISILGKKESSLNYPLKMDWESLRDELLQYGIRNSRILAIAPTATSGKCINATEGIDPPRKLKYIQEGTYSLPFIVPNLRENREYYRTTFQVANKDIIELAAIRQKFICMGQSVSLAYKSLKSSHEHISNIMYAEELGLKTIYYTHTQTAGDEEPEVCESCGS
jgi:ribonucleoside-diphosphate reductase alpha chain